jgi:hypothetical protein
VPTRLTRKLAADYDRLLRRTFTALLRMPVSDAAWDEVTLPMRLRATGLGIATASSVAPVTFHHHDFRRRGVDEQEAHGRGTCGAAGSGHPWRRGPARRAVAPRARVCAGSAGMAVRPSQPAPRLLHVAGRGPRGVCAVCPHSAVPRPTGVRCVQGRDRRARAPCVGMP